MVNRNTARTKGWTSAAATRLLSYADPSAKSVEDALRLIVQGLLKGLKYPPTPLESIAGKLGVHEIREEQDLPGSGELRRKAGQLILVLNPETSVGRRRFTFAHELGHALLARTGPRAPTYGRELERICDLFAAEILMPTDVFIGAIREAQSFDRIFQMAREFKTSVTAATIRWAELADGAAFEAEGDKITWRFRISANVATEISRLVDEESPPNGWTKASLPFRRWEAQSVRLGNSPRRLTLLLPLQASSTAH